MSHRGMVHRAVIHRRGPALAAAADRHHEMVVGEDAGGGEAPRRARRPVRLSTVAEGSALTRITNLSKVTGPRSAKVPFPTSPSGPLAP